MKEEFNFEKSNQTHLVVYFSVIIYIAISKPF